MHRLRRWLRRHDPEGYALHRAVRLALAATTVLAVCDLVLGDPEVVTFGVFGSFALLLFADFPGSPAGRLGSYLGLVVVGCLLIGLGTLASSSWWAATLAMLVVGTLVAFAGTVSAAVASARNATLLLFVLPVTLPAAPAEIPARLAGWGVAAAVCVPAALLLWPPREHDRLRSTSAAACTALGAELAALCDARPAGQVDGAFDDLRRALRGTAYRPVTLTTGSRLLLRLADELEWLRQLVRVSDQHAVGSWPPWTRQVVRSCAEILAAAGGSLRPDPHTPAAADARRRLDVALAELADTRRKAADELADELVRGVPLTADQRDHHTQRAHAWAYAAELAGRTAAASAAADARPLVDRLLGRGSTPLTVGPVAAAGRLAAQQVRRDSVWLQNSMRTGAGLAIAVLVAQLSHVQHGFWVVLGAMSVLRTSAVTTTSTVLRALLGTVAGFVVGGGLILLAGDGPATLWVLLPVAVLVAGFAPQTVSFAVGQAAFTVAVLILFNILQPVGWQVGLVRVQDVAIGCAAALVVGLLLWPGSADARVRHALAEAYRTTSDLLVDTVRRALAPDLTPTDDDAASAALRLDSALRQYLAERGFGPEGLETVTAVTNGVGRLRLAAEAIEQLPRPDPVPSAAEGQITALLLGRSAGAQGWFHGIAGALVQRGLPVPDPLPDDTQELVVGLLAAARRPRTDAVARRDLQLAWVGLFLDDTAALSARLGGPVARLCLGGEPRPETTSGADQLVDARRDGVANGT
ncbi:FUSC family protein [Cellulomonas sp. ICMP 17802]|uniref:FUSC family protein n=1 Tax=Cellulomonas sp. ICMP 17802 TaxID=3239199 RepID=UPI00351BD084